MQRVLTVTARRRPAAGGTALRAGRARRPGRRPRSRSPWSTRAPSRRTRWWSNDEPPPPLTYVHGTTTLNGAAAPRRRRAEPARPGPGALRPQHRHGRARGHGHAHLRRPRRPGRRRCRGAAARRARSPAASTWCPTPANAPAPLTLEQLRSEDRARSRASPRRTGLAFVDLPPGSLARRRRRPSADPVRVFAFDRALPAALPVDPGRRPDRSAPGVGAA